MSQKKPNRDLLISILGTVRSNESDNFFGVLNRFHLLLIRDKHGPTIITIPAWPVLAALVVFLLMRARSSKRSKQS